MKLNKLIVVKIGSAVLSKEDYTLNKVNIKNICNQLAKLSAKYRIVIVSSGAVACGKKYLAVKKMTLEAKRAAASIGNVHLIEIYQQYFKKYQLTVAQALLERNHFANRQNFITLKNTFEFLWKQNIIPIVNENDVINDYELKFTDNDELATLVACCFSASKLFFATTTDGVLNNQKKTIAVIKEFDEKIFSYVHTLKNNKKQLGSGGMLSKLHCAKLATQLGCETIIFNAERKNILLDYNHQTTKTLENSKDKLTVCLAQNKKLSFKHKWVAAGSITNGILYLDKGAVSSIEKKKNLLGVGIKKISGTFKKKDCVQLYSSEQDHKRLIGIARVNYDSETIKDLLKKSNKTKICSTDEIAVF